MKANTHIRALQEREDRLVGTLNRRRKYKVLDPTDRFKKRKELKLKRPEDVYIPKVSREEAAEIKTKLKQNVFVPITNNNDCHQITEYFKVTPKNMKKKKKASKTRDTANADSQTKKRRNRVAKLVLPSHSDF